MNTACRSWLSVIFSINKRHPCTVYFHPSPEFGIYMNSISPQTTCFCNWKTLYTIISVSLLSVYWYSHWLNYLCRIQMNVNKVQAQGPGRPGVGTGPFRPQEMDPFICGLRGADTGAHCTGLTCHRLAPAQERLFFHIIIYSFNWLNSLIQKYTYGKKNIPSKILKNP